MARLSPPLHSSIAMLASPRALLAPYAARPLPFWRRAAGAAGLSPRAPRLHPLPIIPQAGGLSRRWPLRPLHSLTDDEEAWPLAPPSRLPATTFRPSGGAQPVPCWDERTCAWSSGSADPGGARLGAGGRYNYSTGQAAAGGGDGGDGGGSGIDSGAESPEERVVSEHVGRQRAAAASQLDPVGARDDRQQPGASAQPATADDHATHGSILPPLDDLRPLPHPVDSATGSDGGGGSNGRGASGWGVDSATKDDSGGGGGVGGRSAAAAVAAVPSWVGSAVAAVPCSTVGYGTRAEVVARLPASIMLLRHAECMTLDDLQAHERVPNHDIPLSRCGVGQARDLGRRLRPALAAAGMRLYLYTSPFLRCSETARLLAEELQEGGLVSGVREAVQLREQDWGNFQDPRVQAECKAERLRYGRFYYRFPSGESVADVYDRLTIFQDHLVRDMCAGRFSEDTCVAIVSHGLTLRVFAMRWLHWSVRQFLQVYNIPNAEPVILHKDVHPSYLHGSSADLPFLPHHTKCLYRLTPRALELMRGADCSMATSNGCWQGQLLAAPQRSINPESEEEVDRQWADVDGMV